MSRPLTTFTELGVVPEIADALSSVGINEAFPIQEMTLSVALGGADLIGQARTGTGKTLAFTIPVLQRILQHPTGERVPRQPKALIVAPTRELALQVAGDVTTASRGSDLTSMTIYGGVAYEPQLETLAEGVDVVIGTPGRILDLVNRRDLDLSAVTAVVLDEADEMLDLGFLPDVQAILSKTPHSRQTMLFSATMPSAIIGLARQHMTQPMNIRAESATDEQTVPLTTQFVWQAHELDKPEIVARILQAEGSGQSIIFTRTKRQAQRVADDLMDRGFPASPLHGDMAQGAREKALQRFRDGKVTTLVATDVAARGIDVAGISHVINWTSPDDHKTYVHRIGRTGRAGASGVAVTFVDWADLTRWKLINAELGLDFADPQETYSTSEHLFADLNIPTDAKGRLKPAEPKQPSTGGNARSGGGRSDSRSGGGKSSQGGGRSRNRTRSAQSSGGADSAVSAGPADASTAPAGEGGSSRPRRRRRRRSTGGDSQGGQPSSS